MTNQSIEPEIDTPDRLDRNVDTSGTEGGWEALEKAEEEAGRRGEGETERKVVRKREEPEEKLRERSGKR